MKTQYVSCAFVLALLLVLVGVQSVFAGSENRKGSAGAMELLLPVGSRGSALSGSLNAVATGVEAIHWNPAGMVRSNGVEAMFSTMKYLADIKVNYFAVATNFGDAGSFGFAIRSVDFGDIPITTTDAPEGTGGNFSPNFITGSVTYARAFTDRIHGGVTAKLVSERVIHTTAAGLAFDFGVQYVSKETGLNLGVTLKNLGPQMRFDGPDLESFVPVPGQEPGSRPRALRLPGAEFELPSTLEIGLGYNYRMNDDNALAFMGDFQNTNFGNDEYRLGAEYAWNNQLFIRGGYMMSQNQEDNIYGPTFGVGFNIPVEGASIMFDYAYRQVDFFDANQWFTVKFGL
jgi:hypothetical protein